MKTLSPAEPARRLERTLVRPDATRRDIEQLCAEARAPGATASVCMARTSNLPAPCLKRAKSRSLASSVSRLGPRTRHQRYETEVAIDHGAQEIEMVLNIGRLKDGDHRYVLRELRDVAEAADERPVKVILETALLTPDEVRVVCELALDSGVHCVCPGTGLRSAATVEEVKSLRAAVGEKFGVKAAGVSDAQPAWRCWRPAPAGSASPKASPLTRTSNIQPRTS